MLMRLQENEIYEEPTEDSETFIKRSDDFNLSEKEDEDLGTINSMMLNEYKKLKKVKNTLKKKKRRISKKAIV
jgi:hypothetical protein